MNKTDKIYIAGHNGMVGSAIYRLLIKEGYNNLILKPHKELNLINQIEVDNFFKNEKPDYVFLCAAKVGGIYANNEKSADFLYENMMIEMNVIYSAFKYKCKKLLFLGSSCIYPKLAKQPIKENSLLTSSLEQTNEAYALAKISGLKYCEYLNKQYKTNYISVMPTNLYGPNDNYHPTYSHVIPGLISKFHNAKINNLPYVTCWGDGSPLREFMYVDDLANFCLYLMNNYTDNETINAGTGEEISIKNLANLIKDTIGYKGEIHWDNTKPNGTPRKYLDLNKSKNFPIKPKIKLKEGLALTYKDFLNSSIRVNRY